MTEAFRVCCQHRNYYFTAYTVIIILLPSDNTEDSFGELSFSCCETPQTKLSLLHLNHTNFHPIDSFLLAFFFIYIIKFSVCFICFCDKSHLSHFMDVYSQHTAVWKERWGCTFIIFLKEERKITCHRLSQNQEKKKVWTNQKTSSQVLAVEGKKNKDSPTKDEGKNPKTELSPIHRGKKIQRAQTDSRGRKDRRLYRQWWGGRGKYLRAEWAITEVTNLKGNGGQNKTGNTN